MSLTGAASLGAFQAGAVAAALVAVQCLQRRDAAAGRPPAVRVDAVGTTSAGALVGLLATRCLLAGLDPVHVLHTSWVSGASWERLRSRGSGAPLSLRRVEHAVRDLLDPRDGAGRPAHRAGPAQPVPLVLHVATGSLQGTPYRLTGSGTEPVAGMTHVVDTAFVLRPGEGADAFTRPERSSPLDVVLASLSHPAVFPPRLLDRRDEYARHPDTEVSSLPASGQHWSSDGSALLDAPLGRSLTAARRAESLDPPDTDPGRRMHLLVHPHTAAPAADERWTDPATRPSWSGALARLVACLDPQPLYDDLRRIEQTNDRVRRAGDLLAALAPHLRPEAGAALRAFLGPAAPPGADERELLGLAVAGVAGLTGKQEVSTEVVSPVRLLGGGAEAQRDVGGLLAGDGAGRFAGFLDPALRHQDFHTGWRSTRAWLPDALRRHGLDDEEVAAATRAVDERDLPPAPRRPPWSGARARLRLARTAGRVARIVVGDALRAR